MSLDLTIDKLDTTSAVVTLSGALSLGTGLKTVDNHLQQLISEGVSRLVLDLTAVPYADSAGLGVLLHAYGKSRAKGGAMRLCGVSERLAALLLLTQSHNLLPSDPDRSTSISALG